MRSEIGRTEIVDQLRSLGVKAGGVLLVHTSFRAVRPIEGGPLGLIEALRDALGPDGTLVMPSWTGDDDAPFDPAATPASPDLGIVADTFWRLPGVLRSDHCFAFAAAGPARGRDHVGPPAAPAAHPRKPDRPRARSGRAGPPARGRPRCRHDAAPGGNPCRRPLSPSEARHGAARRATGPHRLRRERPLLPALCARRRMAEGARPSSGRARGACACPSRPRPRHRRGGARASGARSAPLPAPAGSAASATRRAAAWPCSVSRRKRDKGRSRVKAAARSRFSPCGRSCPRSGLMRGTPRRPPRPIAGAPSSDLRLTPKATFSRKGRGFLRRFSGVSRKLSPRRKPRLPSASPLLIEGPDGHRTIFGEQRAVPRRSPVRPARQPSNSPPERHYERSARLAGLKAEHERQGGIRPGRCRGANLGAPAARSEEAARPACPNASSGIA